MSQPQPVQPNTTIVKDPFGSGATFNANPNSANYNIELEKWLLQRQQAYQQTQQYQRDQAANNPAIARGEIPAIGFVAETPNAWGIPVGGRVTSLEQTASGGYNVGFQPRGEPQQVKVSGPGYSIEGTIYASNAQEAANIALGSARAQYRGMDVSPRALGGYISDMRGSNQASVQAGDPAQNKYWESVGLPQFSGFEVPKLSSQQEAEGFYIKSVESAGIAPKISLGNKPNEAYWQSVGLPQYGNLYDIPSLSQEQIQQGFSIMDITAGETGPVISIGQKTTQQAINEPQESNFDQNITDYANDQLRSISAGFQSIRNANRETQEMVWGFNVLPVNQQISKLNLMLPDLLKGVDTSNLSSINFDLSSNSFKLNYKPLSNPIVNPLGPDPQSMGNATRIIDGKLLVNKAFNVKETDGGLILTPKSSGSNNLANALNMSNIKQQAGLYGNLQGTRTLGFTQEQILSGLSPSDKAEFQSIQTQQALFRGASAAAFVIAGATTPLSLPTSLSLGAAKTIATQALIGGGLNVGINQAVKGVTGEGLLTPTEALTSFGVGALIGGGSFVAIRSISKIAPTVMATQLGRAGINTVIGGGIGYFGSGGDPLATATGTFVGFGSGLIGEGVNIAKAKFPETKIYKGITQPVQTSYNKAVYNNELFRPTLTEKIVMKTTGFQPVKPKASYQLLPTVPTTTEWTANKAGYITDNLASDMGVTFKTATKTPIPLGAESSPKNWEGNITLQRGAVIRAKTLVASDLTDTATMLYGRSMDPDVFYAKGDISLKNTGNLGAKNVGALKGSTNKVNPLTESEKNFYTNRAVDDYLADLDIELKVKNNIPKTANNREVKPTEPFKFKSENVNPKLDIGLEETPITGTLKTKFANPADFEEARNLFNNNQKAEIQTVNYELQTAKPTGIEKIVSDEISGRTINTGRRAASNEFWGLRANLIQPKNTAIQTPYTKQSIGLSLPKNPNTVLAVNALTDIAPTSNNSWGYQANNPNQKNTEITANSFSNVALPNNLWDYQLATRQKRETQGSILPSTIGLNIIKNNPASSNLSLGEMALEETSLTLAASAAELDYIYPNQDPFTELAPKEAPFFMGMTKYPYPKYRRKETDDSKKKGKRKISNIFSITAFRTADAPNEAGVQKQVVNAELVNFYPTTDKKKSEMEKAQKAPNSFFRAVKINGVSGIGEFKSTGQDVAFYPAGFTRRAIDLNNFNRAKSDYQKNATRFYLERKRRK